jgi:hypothetical protein
MYRGRFGIFCTRRWAVLSSYLHLSFFLSFFVTTPHLNSTPRSPANLRPSSSCNLLVSSFVSVRSRLR